MALKRNDYILGAIVLYIAYVLFFKKEGYAKPLYNCRQHTNTMSCGGVLSKMNGCIYSQNMCKCNDSKKCTEKLPRKEELKQVMIGIQNDFINELQKYLNDTKIDNDERIGLEKVINSININGVKKHTDKIGCELKKVVATGMLGSDYTKAFEEYTTLTNQICK